MGKPKKNKKAEIKARRKTRKVNARIDDLKQREKRARAYIKILTENAEAFQKLAESEALESEALESEEYTEEESVTQRESSSSQHDQSTQQTSE